MAEAGQDPRDSLAGRDIRPVVSAPRKPIPLVVAIPVLIAIAILLFLWLDGRRHATVAPVRSPHPVLADNVIGAPPPLTVPAPPPEPVVPPPAPAPVMVPPPPPPPPPPPRYEPPPQPPQPMPYVPLPVPSPPPRGGSNDPVVVLDQSIGTPPAQSVASAEDAPIRATMLTNRRSLVPQGTMIAAVLETPIDSTKAGTVRAIVSRDTRGFDGSKVLIPRGSRLIGEARADVSPGQKRVLVMWNRLIRPDGIAIHIGSPAADAEGAAGVAGSVNNHFLDRLLNAVLQSALTVGTNIGSRPLNGSGSIYVGVPSQLSAAGQSLLPTPNLSPTIKVPKGAEITIVVARDLDFGGLGAEP